MSGLAHLLNGLPELCRSVLQAGVGLMLQSTLLLGLGLLAGRWLGRRGPATAALVYQVTLVSLVLGALLAVLLGGRLQPMLGVGLPSVRAAASGTPAPDPMLSRDAHAGPLPALLPQSGLDRPDPSHGRNGPQGNASPLGGHVAADIDRAVAHEDQPAPMSAPVTSLGWLYVCLVVLWASGVLVRLVDLVGSYRTIAHWQKAGMPANDPATDLLRLLCAARRLRPPQLRVSPNVHSPVLTGIWRPAILLPASYEQDFDPQALRSVLAHELAHLARGDCGWILLARLTCAFGWVQPLVWVLAHRVEECSEEVCDEAVLRQEADPRTYARCLIDLAERRLPVRREHSAGIGMARGRSSVERRVRGILSRHDRVRPPLSRSLQATVVLGAAAVGVVGLFLTSATSAPGPEAAGARGIQVSRGDSGGGGERQRSILDGVAALAKPITVTETKIPLGELVARVAADTGVTLTAALDVADEPVDVVVKDLPARELLEQLADLLDYQWTRRGNARNLRYVVYQDVASRQREERSREAALADAWRRLGEQIPQYVQMAARPPAEIQRLLDEEKRWGERFFQLPYAQRLAVDMKDRAQRRQFLMAEQLASPVTRSEAALLGQLTPAQWALLRQGQPLVFSTDPKPGETPLPEEIARAFRGAQPSMGSETHYGSPEFQRAMRERRQGLITAWAEANGYQVRIALDTSRLQSDDEISLEAAAIPLHGGQPANRAASLPANGAMMGIGVGPSYVFPWGADEPDEKANAARRAVLAKDPVFGAKKPLKVDLKPHRPEEPYWKGYAGLGEMFPDVARVYGVSLVSDAYQGDRTTARFSSSEPIALYDLLDRLAGDRHVWDHHERLVRFRYRAWTFARRQEVPLRLLRRWQGLLDRDGALPLQEWLSAATLTDLQLDTLFHWAMFRGPAAFTGPCDPRYALRLYMSLTPGQQQALWRGRPLPFAQMTPAQQGLFLATLRDQAQIQPGILVPGSEPAVGPEAALSLTSDRKVWVFEQHGNWGRVHYEPVPKTAGAAPAPPPRASTAAAQPTITRRTITTVTFHFRSNPEREESVPINVASPP